MNPPMRRLRIATRRSQLALTQSRQVAARLRRHWPGLQIEEVHVVTRGDRIQDRPLRQVGGKGLFVAEVEAVVARGEADLAVHSLKDVPGDVGLAEGMAMLCVPERQDPRDALVGREPWDLAGVPTGARLGTSSVRRAAQLRRHRPDLQLVALRGNVDTRLRKVREGACDVAVLAMAGLRRLGLVDSVRPWPLPVDTCLPAVGQGILALEGRAEDAALRELLAPLEHVPSRLEMEAERALVTTLRGDCHSAIAGLARWEPEARRLTLQGWVGDPAGGPGLHAAASRYCRMERDLDAARALGRQVACTLLEQGARALLDAASAGALARGLREN